MAGRGRLVVVSGPSGAGKSTVVRELLARRPDATRVVTVTTRPPRAADVRAYDHVSREEFERMRNGGEFLEWAEVYGELYGTPRARVERALADGKTVLLEIDVQGARAVREAMPGGALLVFVEPPDWATLEVRLRGRGSEDPEGLARRLETARRELASAPEFDAKVVNDDLEEAVAELDRIISAT